jgi:hypothetical protein
MTHLGVAGDRMKRFVEATDRGQGTLFPECLDDWVDEANPVRVIDAFVDALNLAELPSSKQRESAVQRARI